MKARTLPGKSRFFIGFGALLVFGLFVLYHTSQQRVDDLRLSTVRCEQHEMAIRSQYELEMDKVGRLEKKLEASRVAEEKLQQKVRAEKDLREKASKDHNLRFSSLQQHYKLLQSEQDDAKAEFANAKEALENRLDVLTNEMGKSDKARLATIEEWKNKYADLEKRFKELAEGKSDSGMLQFKNRQLTDELTEMRKHCAFRLDNNNNNRESPSPLFPARSTEAQEVLRSFDEQVVVDDNTYHIPIHVRGPQGEDTNPVVEPTNRTMNLQRDESPPPPTGHLSLSRRRAPGGIINSVENFQILPKPLASNDNENVLKGPEEVAGGLKSSTPSTVKKSGELNRALPIVIIQPQSSTAGQQRATSSRTRKVPEGVVPIPESMNALLHKKDIEEAQEANLRPESSNGRYGNVAAVDAHVLPESEEHKEAANFLQNAGNEGENGAHEVNDFNIVEDRNHHDHLQEVLDDEKIVINNNAAEVERAVDDVEKEKRNEIDLAIINRDLHGGERKDVHPKKNNEEFVADQGLDDHMMEEHVEEEDDDEYPNLAAQQEEGHAVRN